MKSTGDDAPQTVPGPRAADGRLLAGDTHGNLDWIRTLIKLATRNGCVGIVQLGDFGFCPTNACYKQPAESS